MQKSSNWFNRKIQNYLTRRNNRKVVKILQKIILEDWEEIYETYLGESKYAFEKVFKRRDLTIRFTRLLRGDLIEAFIGEKEIASWVDQSHQYSGLMGLNDVLINVDAKDLEIYK